MMEGERGEVISNLDRVAHADRLLERAGELAAKADALLDMEEWEQKEQEGLGEVYDVTATAELYVNLAYSYLYSVEIRKSIHG